MKSIVLIPAMGCDGRLYSALAQALAPVLSVTVVIGDKDNFKDCVTQVLAAAPPKFIVLGTSFGGRVALEVALSDPSRVAGLVVSGAGAGAVADPTLGFTRAARLRGGEFEAVVGEMADMVSHMAGPNGSHAREMFVTMARDNGGALMAAQSEALAKRLDLTQRLGEIFCPSLMLWGHEDKFSPASDGLKMSAAIPNGRFVEISECGHFPSLEAPDETIEILLHWLQDTKLISG